MKLERHQLLQRHDEFPRTIIELSHNNMVIHRMVEAYVHGQIATKEEAYCQIIMELAKTRDELMERMIDEARLKTVLFAAQPLS